MIHVKTYEEIRNPNSFKYKVGDYVYFKRPYKWKVFPVVKIIDLSISIDYYVEAFMKENPNRLDNFWLEEDEILRIATPKEIEEYKLKKDMIKYNL
jgi:hypothetical protein